jgi:energy-coupling factor transporter ATP-binding protein EcfA2
MTTKKATKQATPTPAPVVPAAPTREPGLKIIAMQVENIKRVKFARIRPKGNMVEVAGPNGSGKSSLLDAIDWAITGTSHIPSQPIRKGERTAQIQIDLGDYKVQRDFTRVDGGKEPYLSKLRVFGKNREQFPTPQSLLDGFLGAISFDPLEFIRMEEKKQLETLRKLVTLDVDIDQLDAEKKTAYDGRRDAGRDVDSAKARLNGVPAPPDGLPDAPIDTSLIAKKLQLAGEHNAEVEKLKSAKGQLATAADWDRERMGAIDEEIKKLDQQIALLVAEKKQRVKIIEATEKQIAEFVIPEPLDASNVAAELNQAQTTNGAIQRRDTYRSLEAQVKEAESRWTAHDATVKAKEKERADAIARAKMPIDKLGIGDGEVLYDGIPFSQASNAEQIRVSVALAMASNPKLRVLRIKDGALLDASSMKLIQEMSTASDYQVWIERVEPGGQVSVVMEDGEATGAETETAPPKPAAK